MRVLVCGSREWTDTDCMWLMLRFLGRYDTLVHGDCRGADRMAAAIAKELGAGVVPFPAKWREFGKAAGPIRNQQMLDEGEPALVIAFHNNLALSKGTADMVRRARKAGIPTYVVSSKEALV